MNECVKKEFFAIVGTKDPRVTGSDVAIVSTPIRLGWHFKVIFCGFNPFSFATVSENVSDTRSDLFVCRHPVTRPGHHCDVFECEVHGARVRRGRGGGGGGSDGSPGPQGRLQHSLSENKRPRGGDKRGGAPNAAQ